MPTPRILTASTIITMDPDVPRATAVAVAADDTIAAVGELDGCRAALGADVDVVDLGDTVLMPGFVEPHSHPLLSGMTTQSPTIWIAPYVGVPTFGDVEALWHQLHAERPAGEVLLFNGLDKMLHGCATPTADSLEQYFPGRAVVVIDNSGHAAYCTHTFLRDQGWDADPPADPAASSFGRNADGSLNGQAYEMLAVVAFAMPALQRIGSNPIAAGAEWYALMATNGITSTSEHAYQDQMRAGYEALAQLPSVPLRLSLYHAATEATCGEPLDSSVDADLLHKNGIKLWADGSPWVGNVGLTFTYLDTPVTRAAGLAGLDTGGERSMNYSRDDLRKIIAAHAPQGWQFTVHVNGDASLDAVLDVLQDGLDDAGLSGTDHRWRVEHLGAARAEQFGRIASLGAHPSMGPFQFIYWGDLLDGQVFEHQVGANWQRFGDAVAAGLRPSFHNDGPVSPPLPLLNVQTALTRRTSSGAVRGEAQRISMDQALAAVTIHGAEALRREHKVGSITPGKLADFVELSADPYTVDPDHLTEQVQVQGTWLSGERVDLHMFLAAAGGTDPTEHTHLHAVGRACC
jgi:predicted amidohydrolase YtcJ